MATHSSILAWKIPWTEEPGRLHHGIAKSWTRLSDFTFFSLDINRASLMAQLVKNLLVMQETQFTSWVRKIFWKRDRLPTSYILGLPLWLS